MMMMMMMTDHNVSRCVCSMYKRRKKGVDGFCLRNGKMGVVVLHDEPAGGNS